MTPGDAFTILVVDDEIDIAESIRDGLELCIDGVKVVLAANGQEGLDVLRDRPIHMILSDYKMPIMDGLEFLRTAQKEFPHVPRIMLTAFPDPELAAEAVHQAGVGLFVSKPFQHDYLVHLVEAIRDDDLPGTTT